MVSEADEALEFRKLRDSKKGGSQLCGEEWHTEWKGPGESATAGGVQQRHESARAAGPRFGKRTTVAV